jgi:hypothetical protein
MSLVWFALLLIQSPEIRLVLSEGDPASAVIEVHGVPVDSLTSLAASSMSAELWNALLSVSVADAETNLPPMLGSYAVERAVLRFKPRFALDRGRRYRVVFHPARLPGGGAGALPIEAEVSVPALRREETTIVERIYPSAATLPENLLKLYIHFSAPMRRGDGLPFIRLLDEAGSEVTEAFLPLGGEFWDYRGMRYTVFFDPGRVKQGLQLHEALGRPLRSGRKYTLVVDSAWRDAEGLPLKASFRKDFRVGPADTTPIDVDTWALTAPPAGSRDPLEVRFPEPLDRGLLDRALGVTTEAGRPVVGEVEVRQSETLWAFTPLEAWRPGAYQLVALSLLEDLAGNKIGKPFEVDLFEKVEESEERESHVLPFIVRDR